MDSKAAPRRAIIVDIDGTLCPIKTSKQQYSELTPYPAVLEALRRYKAEGWQIVLSTSRNMNTFNGNLGLINAQTAPVLVDWLRRWDIPFDEIHFGKPWPGHEGFYVDDRAIRPDELLRYSPAEIEELIASGRRSLGTADE